MDPQTPASPAAAGTDVAKPAPAPGMMAPIDSIAPKAPDQPLTKDYALFKAGGTDVAALIKENIGDGKIGFTQLTGLTWPTGKQPAWQVDLATGPLAKRELDCVILRYADGRVLWGSSFEESNGDPPVCVSDDNKTGVGNPGGDCATCKFAQWGSKEAKADGTPSRGQACSERRRLFVMVPWSLLPIHLNIPPTSLKAIRGYFIKLISLGLPYYSVTTKLKLKEAANKDGVAYAELECEMMGRLTEQEFAIFREINRQFDGTFKRTSVVPPTGRDAEASAARGEGTGAGGPQTVIGADGKPVPI